MGVAKGNLREMRKRRYRQYFWMCEWFGACWLRKELGAQTNIWVSASLPDKSNVLMCSGGRYAKVEKNAYGRIKAGASGSGQVAWDDGHAHCERTRHQKKRAATLGERGVLRCDEHAGLQVAAQRVGLMG